MFDRLLEYCLRIIINTVALTTNNQNTRGEMIEKKKLYLANYFFVFCFFHYNKSSMVRLMH